MGIFGKQIGNPTASGVGLPVGTRVYRALLTQSGLTIAPTVTLLENTLGGTPAFATPEDAGVYRLQGVGLFPAGTTVLWTFGFAANYATAGTIFSWQRLSDDEIIIRTFDISSNPAEWEVTGGTLSILVYP